MKTLMLTWLFISASVFADQGTTVVPREPVVLNDINFSGQATPSNRFAIIVHAQCFAANLRSVPNPLNPKSKVKMDLGLRRQDGTTGVVSVTFDAKNIFEDSGTVETLAPTYPRALDPKIQSAIGGQTLVIAFSSTLQKNKRLFDLISANFTQVSNPVTGVDTEVKPKFTATYTADSSMLFITAEFAGLAGTCGAFYSPLMFFFSEKRPALDNSAEFNLNSQGKKFYWPEGSPDYAFLAYDQNRNGRIDSGTELFGKDDKNKNGFESLKRFDTNHDGKITAGDREFKKLNLWFDLNGNGKTEAGELVSLNSRGITEISLEYKDGQSTPLGSHGDFREEGRAKSTKGDVTIIDVWFGIKEVSK